MLIASAVEQTELFHTAEHEFERLESLFSRFRSASELCRLNHARKLPVSPELFELVRLALAGREATGGRFDTTVHDAIVAAGNSRTFEQIDDAAYSWTTNARSSSLGLAFVSTWEGSQRVKRRIARAPFSPSTTRASSTQAAVRRSLDGDPWPVAVVRSGELLTLELVEGALATSETDNRTWMQAGRPRHNLIDPRTGSRP